MSAQRAATCALALLLLLASCLCSELPPGWSAHNWQGKTYYYNRQTGASQWERPTGSQVITTTPLAPAAADPTAVTPDPNAQQQQQSQHSQLAGLRAELARAMAERDSALQSKKQSIDLYAQLEARLNTTLQSRTTLQAQLDEAAQENRQLQLRLTDTREQLIAAQHKITQLSETVATLRRMVKDADVNATVVESHLEQAMARIEQQERELADAYKEIEKLDRRLRELARSRAQTDFASFLPRAIRRLLPFKRPRAFKTALLMDEIEGRLNRTIKALRQNNTALAQALHSKTVAMDELTARASQSEARAEQATRAHTALREQLDLLVAKLAERDKQSAAYESSMEALRKELDKSRAEAERERQARKAALSSEHQELKQKYDELQHTLEAKDRMIEALNSTASSLQQSLVSLRHQLAITSEELGQLRESSGTWSKLRKSRWFSWCFLGLL